MVSGKVAGKVFIYRLFLKLAKTLRKKQKKTENNQIVWGKDAGKVLIYRPWFVFFYFVVFLFPVLHLYFGLSSVLSNLHTSHQGKKQH